MLKSSKTLALCGLVLLAACSSSSEGETGSTKSTGDGADADASTSSGSPGNSGSSGGLDGGANNGGSTDPNDGSIFDPDNLPGGGYISIDTQDGGVFVVLCGNAPCGCSDGKDNDGDGVADGLDDECTGPFDDDEATFATGIPGDNKDPKWQDCFFDGNSGAGDDGCRYHTDCITGKADQTDERKCGVSDECVKNCQPLTPPGCDCFGCCGVVVAGKKLNILVGESCSTENIDDETACPRCTPTESCNNECGECELCVGKTIEDLPKSCFKDPPPPTGAGGAPADGGTPPTDPNDPPPPPNVCDNDATPCRSSADCGGQSYCSLGCCKLNIVIR